MLLRVFTLTLSPPVRIVSSAALPGSLLSGTTLLGHYKSNPLQPLTRYLSAPRAPSYLAVTHAPTHAQLTRPRTCTHTHARRGRSPSRLSTERRQQRSLEHGRAVARQVLTRKHGIEAADQEARDSLIRLARGVTVISISQSRPDD